ncbi:RRN3-domain-containing protein [Teratosphaeria nubilosa]|uniref:RRN3-domain-containing protein n=1 Tax=Teratosphaeria nubilosa TaxID=161662 RepID=A0A6G1LHB2_9PEZI|nr:RRN3-domain-containing protein [Teratosphaeria nubilosa]
MQEGVTVLGSTGVLEGVSVSIRCAIGVVANASLARRPISATTASARTNKSTPNLCPGCQRHVSKAREGLLGFLWGGGRCAEIEFAKNCLLHTISPPSHDTLFLILLTDTYTSRTASFEYRYTVHDIKHAVAMVSLAAPATAGAMPPPPTPLTKRPTLGMKRDSSYLDTDDEHSLSSTTKRLKVEFDPNVEIRILDDWNEKSLELVKEEVRVGVEKHLASGDKRDDTEYIKLLQLLGQEVGSGEAPSGRLLKKYLLAVEAKVSSLGDCGKLVSAVLELSWLGRDDVFAQLYVRFLTTLATAHTKFVPSITQKLVSHFARLPASLGRLPGEDPVSRTVMFKRLHTAIATLLRLVPSVSGALARAVQAEFPNESATTHTYMQYERHLLRLAKSAPELNSQILSLITRQLVEIDVQIQQDYDDLQEEIEDRLFSNKSSQTVPTLPEDADGSDDESVSESEETMTEDGQRVKEIMAKVDKMDGTMDMLFEYYDPLIRTGSRADINEAYDQLLTHFSAHILGSRTRHAQFLLFHFSQTLPQHIEVFVQRCLDILSQFNAKINDRLNACAYLASFVARGAHIATATVRDIFLALCQFLDDLRRRCEPTCRGPDKRAYALYYAVAQAILYIFCFRWRDLTTGSASPEPGDADLSDDEILAENRELGWIPGVKEIMHKNIHSKLNPLKVCSPSIVGEWAKIALYLRFMYVFSILETNKRVRLGNGYSAYSTNGMMDLGRRETAMDRKAGEAHLQLEAYFPFDPYNLPKSKHWVQGDYNKWKLPSGMKQDDDEDEEDSDDDESDEESLDGDLEGELPVSDRVSVSS